MKIESNKVSITDKSKGIIALCDVSGILSQCGFSEPYEKKSEIYFYKHFENKEEPSIRIEFDKQTDKVIISKNVSDLEGRWGDFEDVIFNGNIFTLKQLKLILKLTEVI